VAKLNRQQSFAITARVTHIRKPLPSHQLVIWFHNATIFSNSFASRCVSGQNFSMTVIFECCVAFLLIATLCQQWLFR